MYLDNKKCEKSNTEDEKSQGNFRLDEFRPEQSFKENGLYK